METLTDDVNINHDCKDCRVFFKVVRLSFAMASTRLRANIAFKFYLGIVTPVKSQDTCGSCAAFAATGAHETCMLKAGARFNGLDLSEQYLVDCGYNPSG